MTRRRRAEEVRDDTTLMQRKMDGVQTGHWLEGEKQRILTHMMDQIQGQANEQEMGKAMLARATRNLKCKVPAVRALAQAAVKKLGKYGAGGSTTLAKMALRFWKRIRSMYLRWARKRGQPVELLQVHTLSIQGSRPRVKEAVSFMQTFVVITCDDKCEWPRDDSENGEFDAFWFERFQRAIVQAGTWTWTFRRLRGPTPIFAEAVPRRSRQSDRQAERLEVLLVAAQWDVVDHG